VLSLALTEAKTEPTVTLPAFAVFAAIAAA
jgi:hypothetical protein